MSSVRCLTRLTTALLFAAGGTTALQAQRAESTKLIRIVVSGGLTLPAGDLKTFHDTGVHADGSVLVHLPGFPLTLRPELSITRLKQKLPDINTILRPPGFGNIDSLGTSQFLSAMGNVEVPLAGGLYLLAGVGVLNLDASNENATKMTMNAGAGMRFHLGPAEGFVEGRFGTASYNAGTFGYAKAQFIPVSFGLAF